MMVVVATEKKGSDSSSKKAEGSTCESGGTLKHRPASQAKQVVGDSGDRSNPAQLLALTF